MLFYSLLVTIVLSGSIYLYDTMATSSSMLEKYKLTQREQALKNEQNIHKAIERYYQAYGVLPASHMDLIASGYISPNSTSITGYKESVVANKYQKALTRYVNDTTKTAEQINTLFNAQTYGDLPQEIKDSISESEYNLMTATKIDYQIINGKIVYSDEFALTALDDRIVASRSSKSLTADNDIINNQKSTYNKRANFTERQLEQAVITLADDDIIKYTDELKTQNYTDEHIASMVKQFEVKRDSLNLY